MVDCVDDELTGYSHGEGIQCLQNIILCSKFKLACFFLSLFDNFSEVVMNCESFVYLDVKKSN